MIDDFFLRILLAAVGIAVAAAPLGCLMIWRRMAFFGEATAHSALLGVAFALAFALPMTVMVLLAALIMSLGVARLTGRGDSADAALGVMSHGALALGLLAISALPGARIDLTSFLMGDILAVSWWDLALIWTAATLILLVGFMFRKPVVLASLDRDLARAANVDPKQIDIAIFAALALFVAVGLKIVGVLLIAAMLVIPAAAARPLATSPVNMALVAIVIATASSVSGVAVSWIFDTATGPTMASMAFAFFALSRVVQR